MNTMLLWAVPIALVSVLALALVGWAVLRHRPRQGQRAAGAPPAKPQAPRPPLPAAQAGSVAAQHQAATEALRQARRRAADEAARQVAERHAVPAALQATPPAARLATPVVARVVTPATTPISAPVEPPPAAALASPVAASVIHPAATKPVAAVAPAAAPPVAPAPTTRPPGPITVLMVDDSKVVRIKTSRLLEKHHYKVLLADDGLTALQALAEQWPDLVITDVEMPGLDGFGLTQQLRSQPRGQAMPVIMITSSNERHRDEAARAGVSVLLGKPYAEAQLLAEVEKALGRVAQPAPAGLLMQ